MQVEEIARDHLRRVGPKSAEKITDKLYESFGVLESYPASGPVHDEPFLAEQGYRKYICGNCVAVYKIEGDTVYIDAIFHGSTNYPERLKRTKNKIQRLQAKFRTVFNNVKR